MIEAAFWTAPMALAGRTDRGATRRGATRRRAIGVAAITRRADREKAVAAPADFLAKRRVHDVGAAARFDWTRRLNRGTREPTGSVASEHRGGHRGSGGSAPGPHLIRCRAQLTPPPRARLSRGSGPCSCHRQMASRAGLVAGIVTSCLFQGGALRQLAPRLSFSEERTPLRRRPSRFTRFQGSADSATPTITVTTS